MSKIFTLLGGLLLASSLIVKAEEVTVYISDENGNDIAYDFDADLTKDADGVYTLANLFGVDEGSGIPFSFKFDQPEVGKYSPIEVTSNISAIDGWNGYYYIKNGNNKYPIFWIYGLNGIDEYVKLRYSFIYLGTNGSYVYRYDTSDSNNKYEYYATMMISGDFYGYNEETGEYDKELFTGEGEESPWLYVEFWFNEPEEAAAQDMPEYPEKLVFTLNGENELPGVKVTQEMVPFDGEDYLTINITGECDADEITLDITTPEGWDGMLVRSDYTGESGEIEPLKAKAPAKEGEDYWMPTSLAVYSGVTEGNTITFPVDGNEWGGMALLVKGEEAYMTQIDFVFDVRKSGEPVVEAPAFPDHLDYTLNGEKELPGVNVRQLIDENTHVFSIKGECEADKITVAFDIPEGWDGMMIADTFGEGEISTVKTRGAELIPVNDILGQGFVEGNAITYATNGEAQWGMIALIKGDMACPTFIDYDLTVSQSGGSDVPGPSEDDPAYPESLVINTFPEEGLEVWQGEDFEIYTIGISGEISEPTFTVVIDIPEGWDGFISIPCEDNIVIDESGFSPKKTRAAEYYWEDIDEVLSWGAIKGNRFTFTPNGEEQDVAIYLYKGDQVEMVNWISLETMVRVNLGSGVNGVSSAENATYYDLNGNQIAKPAKGMYVKIVDGKATKVVVK